MYRNHLILFALSLLYMGCGYGFVSLQDSLPGKVKKVSIPIFQNRTHEAALENVLTSDLRKEFFKSKIIEVVSSSEAQAEIQGVITSVSLNPVAHSEKDLSGRSSKVLANEYTATIEVSVSLVKISTKEVLWSRSFSNSRQYLANEEALKNEMRKREAFTKISVYLMEQAHDMMLEDF